MLKAHKPGLAGTCILYVLQAATIDGSELVSNLLPQLMPEPA
jgi:hypothetical protein